MAEWRDDIIRASLTGMAMMLPLKIKLAMTVSPPTLVELLAIRLSPQAGKSLVIPQRERGKPIATRDSRLMVPFHVSRIEF
jgi:hypothetical protein